MSNNTQIIPERSRDIGNFLVGRLIPFRKKRMVGPFIFIDHMEPVEVKPGNYADIGQHPHIGLSTLTYLFEGEMMHRDSIGTIQRITAGDVNFMTAGKGVVHTERTPEDMRDGKTYPIHGFQIWVALPKNLEEIEPTFQHIPKTQLPKWTKNNIDFTLVAGSAFGKTSPVKVHSHLFMLELKNKEEAIFQSEESLKGEIGICVVSGKIEAEGEIIEEGNMLVSKKANWCSIKIHPNTHILIFGGEPLEEERFIHWNFVASTQAKIEKAKQRWQGDGFELIEGEGPKIPLP